jgi:hypothetical protein
VLLPVLLTVVGLLVALAPAQLGLPDPPDWIPLALLGAAAAWGSVAWARRPTRRRLALAAVPALAAGGMAYWMLGFSAYEETAGAPRLGDAAPPVTAVRVRDGARFDLVAERGRQVLLVFFRGRW